MRILRKLRLKGAFTDASLEELVLHSLKLTIMGNTRSQNFFRVIGGVEVLLDGVGTPITSTEGSVGTPKRDKFVSACGTTHGRGNDGKIFDEFHLQVLSLQVLREAMYPPASLCLLDVPVT